MSLKPPLSDASQSSGISLDELARRAAAGDEVAFEAVHRRLSGGLRGFIQRRSAARGDLLEELAQAAWVEIWRALNGGAYDANRSRISTFVYAVAFKIVLRHLRQMRQSQRGGPVDAESLGGLLMPQESPDGVLHASELIEALRDCIQSGSGDSRLSPEEQQIVIGLSEGATERALGEELRLAASTVHSRKHAALQKIRRCLARKGFREFAPAPPERGGRARE